jgi:starch synthase
VLFVGRVTRQKGIVHLLEAAADIDRSAQLVFCAGSADTAELADEVHQRVNRQQETRSGIVWIEEMLPRSEVIQLLSHASVFVCPSIYEPFGLVNLEAMACETPVVASHVGGIPEVVEDGVTGYLVPLEQGTDGEPLHPERFARDLAAAINRVLQDPAHGRALGRAGRQRVVERFSWSAVAQRTAELYRTLVPASRAG